MPPATQFHDPAQRLRSSIGVLHVQNCTSLPISVIYLHQLLHKDGLPSDRVNCILEDQRGNLWMSTNRGISRFDTVSKTFKNYSRADGLPGMDFTGWLTCFKSTTGRMFFGGFSGATSFCPDKVVDITYVPPIVFTDFGLFGRALEVGSRSPLKKSISYTDKVTLSHQQSTFAVEFAALSYSDNTINRYRYKLDGLDQQWTETGSDQRMVNYAALPTGSYTFHVQTATGQSGWGFSGATLHIRVLPHGGVPGGFGRFLPRHYSS
jgi:hypothetical protein